MDGDLGSRGEGAVAEFQYEPEEQVFYYYYYPEYPETMPVDGKDYDYEFDYPVREERNIEWYQIYWNISEVEIEIFHLQLKHMPYTYSLQGTDRLADKSYSIKSESWVL